MLRNLFAMVSMLLLLTCIGKAALPVVEPPVHSRQSVQKEDSDEALATTTKAVNNDPLNPSRYAARAIIYDARREFDKAVSDYSKAIELSPAAVLAFQRRGEDHFRLRNFKQSVADFDKVIELEPEREPYHWQRGLSLYYAGDFARGAKQFEAHQSVNPNDVENAVWHYLCVARVSGTVKAREGLIKIEGDARVPMMRVYAMFAGSATAADVLKEAEAGEVNPDERKRRLFYAHLYIGLYYVAAGQTEQARGSILPAAERFAADDYMGDVARVQASILQSKR